MTSSDRKPKKPQRVRSVRMERSYNRQDSQMTVPSFGRIPLPLLASPFFGGGVGNSSDYEDPVVWVLTDNRTGNVSQAIGVAESLGWAFDIKPVEYTPWVALPNILRGASLWGVTNKSRGILEQSLADCPPDIVISAGRRMAPVARWIKKNAAPRSCFLCHIMWPGYGGLGDFDVIAVPTHDRISAGFSNVMRITGAPHRVTEGRLAVEGARWHDRLCHLKSPLIAVIVGGSTRKTRFTSQMAIELGETVAEMVRETSGSLVVTTSRRTEPDVEKALFGALPKPAHAFHWASGQENPYFGYLALADMIVVTGDSVSMASEACASRASVFIYAPPNLVTPRHAQFHRHLYALGMAAPLSGACTAWQHPPLNAAVDIARMIRLLLLGEEEE